MDVFAAIADERRRSADLLESLEPASRTAPSLCGAWQVRDVFAHLLMPLVTSLPAFGVAMLRSGLNFDRASERLTAGVARQSDTAIADGLRTHAASHFTPPGHGPATPLTDLLVHGLDIRWPLGIDPDYDPERVNVSLAFLCSGRAPGFVPKGATGGLRIEATDTGFASGPVGGSLVRGTGDDLLLALCGRPAGFGGLTGDGVTTLASRLRLELGDPT